MDSKHISEDVDPTEEHQKVIPLNDNDQENHADLEVIIESGTSVPGAPFIGAYNVPGDQLLVTDEMDNIANEEQSKPTIQCEEKQVTKSELESDIESKVEKEIEPKTEPKIEPEDSSGQPNIKLNVDKNIASQAEQIEE